MKNSLFRPIMVRLVIIVALWLAVVVPTQVWASCLLPGGDITGDNTTTVADVTCLASVGLWGFYGKTEPYPACAAVPESGADINCSGAVDVVDAQLLILMVLKMKLPKSIDPDGDGCAESCALQTIPESQGYQLLYRLALPGAGVNWDAINQVPYAIDNTDEFAGTTVGRVGYLLELNSGSQETQWVFVSMDSFTQNLKQLGVPTDWMFDRTVDGLSVQTNVASLSEFEVKAGGKIEFWPDCYQTDPNAVYDTDDLPTTTDCYGSMQVHYGNSTIFAINSWSNGSILDVGIGNQPTSHPDWTFAHNAATYSVKNLYVFVQPLEIPIAAGYDLLYKITADPNADWDSPAAVPYGIDRSAALSDIAPGRVGYYVETVDADGNAFWAWVTMKAFTADIKKLGVPTDWTFDQQVFGLSVETNKPGVPTVANVSGGNMEFWPDCYNAGANSVYDYDDDSNGQTDCYGSMQIHYGGQTLFALNGWSWSGADDFGLGSQPVSHPDWTFAANVGSYAIKNIYVFVQPLDPQAETTGYQLVYGLDLPGGVTDWDTPAQIPYAINNAAQFTQPVTRYGYYLELASGGNLQWVWASMDALNSAANKAGIPIDDIFDGAVSGLTIKSNHPGITPVTNSSNGKVEFWSNCYAVGANGVYDYDDDMTSTDCHGSMQLFSGTSTVFAFNGWSQGSQAVAIGLGPYTGTHPDWTFATNGSTYSVRRLFVYVK